MKRRPLVSAKGWPALKTRCPIHSPITLRYRLKGVVFAQEFSGPVAVITTVADRRRFTWKQRCELPLVGDEWLFNLTHLPVITIGSQNRCHPTADRARRFLNDNPTFGGAILIQPDSTDPPLRYGVLLFTSDKVLNILWPQRWIAVGMLFG